MKKKIKIAVLSAVAVVLVALVLVTLWGNTALELNQITASSEKLPESFEGFRIAHVSDLHNAEFGDKNQKLLSMLESANPHIIAITGDIVDSGRTDVKVSLDFVKEAVKIAPCYYVTGNHEARIPEDYEKLKAGFEDAGVKILEDEKLRIERSGEFITIAGVADPDFLTTDWSYADFIVTQKLETLLSEEDGYTVLLSHRPELFETYAEQGVDLVLSGHAHGGQFRLPFIGGVYAPAQGFFPEYDAGLYTENDTNMIVSRGLGNSIFPLRINNRPEVILIELKSLP